jgi:sugar transferase (PEP-CTERM system associated)
MAFLKHHFNLRSLKFFLGDLVICVIAFLAGFYLRFGVLEVGLTRYAPIGQKAVVFVVTVLFCSFWAELYNNHDKSFGRKEIMLRIGGALIFSYCLLSAFYCIVPSLHLGMGIRIFALLFFGVFQGLWRLFYESFPPIPGFAKRVLILGTGPTAEMIGNLINSTSYEYVLAGYLNSPAEPVNVPIDSVVGDRDNIVEAAKRTKTDKLVVSLTEKRGALPLSDMLACKFSGVDVMDAPSFYEQLTGKLLIEHTNPSWFIFSDGFRVTAFKQINKWVFDKICSIIGVILFSPLIPIIAVFIKLDSPGPVFFRQLRVGKNDKNFWLYKFRTMVDNAESVTGAVWAQESDPRITRMGRILRKTRLDEIPQLFSVLKGDMSMVGPRPERPEFVDELKKVIPYYSERHFIKPGLTGWAQIKYSYGSSVEDAIEKLRYDLYYMKHLSFFVDLLILSETFAVVFLGKGAR